MTDFPTVADLRHDLQRQYDAFAERRREIRATFEGALEAVAHEEELVAARLVTVDQVLAIIESGVGPDGRETAAERTHEAVTAGETAPSPRQRQDVRGPVLALLRECGDELSADNICRRLPDLKRASIMAALRAAEEAGEIKENNGLYWHEEPARAPPGNHIEQPSRDDREERRAPAPDQSASLSPSEPASAQPPPEEAAPVEGVDDDARTAADDRQGGDSDRHPERLVPRSPFAYERKPDPRALTDTSPASQARALRAAVERAGPAGLDEDNACVDPIVIAGGIEAGWLRRTMDDRGPRLWIADAEQEDAAE